MSLRYPGGNDPNDTPRNDFQIAELIRQEQMQHRHITRHRRSMALCSCGQVFNGPESWRWSCHVEEVTRVYENRLRGLADND